MSAAVPPAIGAELDAIAIRLAKLSDLLGALAVASASQRLQEPALLIAADYAHETYARLEQVIDPVNPPT